jgi:hypothetical protein
MPTPVPYQQTCLLGAERVILKLTLNTVPFVLARAGAEKRVIEDGSASEDALPTYQD